jgi:tRNA (guanine37-N1)-methyltransferase
LRVSILTLFPEFFNSPLESSLIGRARQAGLLTISCLELRSFGEGKYRAVDDKLYGGGVGMVMMPAVLEKALSSLLGGDDKLAALEAHVKLWREEKTKTDDTRFTNLGDQPLVVFLSPQGRKLSASYARSLAQTQHLILICGHYEGVDERAIEAFCHEELSIGDYVLTGGEPAALVTIDAISRFIPGVVGEAASVDGDTFENSAENHPGGLKAPVFTRPALWRGRDVPAVLLSGNHGEISKWRRAESALRTKKKRPDLG